MSKKKKGSLRKNAGFVFALLIGAVCGFLGVEYLGPTLQGKALPEQLTTVALCVFGLLAAAYLQTIIHEAGHLVCGMLTGYKFSSFRIGSFMWLKENEKVVFKRLSLLGTAGQCLMAPPNMADGKFPFVFYNLGGALLNIIAGLLFLGLAALCKNTAYLSLFLFFMSIVGFAYALMNEIPMRLGTIDNDGYNAVSLGESSEAARSFWMQLNMNAQIAKGMRLKDMPNEWFYMPSDEGMKNSMTAVMGVVYCNLLMDTHAFKEAYQLMDRLLKMDCAMVGLHRSLMNCDRIYCELIGENRKERLNAILDEGLKKFMKSMRNFPAVLRTEYAYAALAEKDADKAEKVKNAFEKRAQTYPYQGDAESERELISIAERLAQQTELK